MQRAVEAEHLARRRIARAAQDLGDFGQRADALAQRAEIARGGLSERGARGQPLEIAHVAEPRTERLAQRRVEQEQLHRVVPPTNGRHLGERGEQPTAQEARARGQFSA